MDISGFMKAFALAKGAIETLKSLKDLLPNSPQKAAAEQTLIQAEKSFRLAEAQAAEYLGYVICQCDWPPQIGLRQSDDSFRCPKCDRNLGTSSGVTAPKDYN